MQWALAVASGACMGADFRHHRPRRLVEAAAPAGVDFNIGGAYVKLAVGKK
jgi:hypothetical protein